MIAEETELLVADNSGAKRVQCFRVLGQRKRYAYVGDVIKVSVKEAQPNGMVKKGQVCNALVVRTRHGRLGPSAVRAMTLALSVPLV